MHRTLSLYKNNKNGIGVALDIDGVLLRGGKVLNGAKNAVTRLLDAKIPLIFMTNGGGVSEKEKADALSKYFGHIHEDQILLAHTPFRDLPQHLKEQPALILGNSKRCLNIASSYGFKDPWCSQRLYATNPDLYPYYKYAPTLESNLNQGSTGIRKEHTPGSENTLPIGSVLVMHDPLEWALDIQMACDVLLGGNPLGSGTGTGTGTGTGSSKNESVISSSSSNVVRVQNIPLYACNNDLVFSAAYSEPRFTQGAFMTSLSAIFASYTGRPPTTQWYGKPFTKQYKYCETMLLAQANKLSVTEPTHFYGIGDNPKADIRGANNAGEAWTSILVRSGIYSGKEGENDDTDPADIIFDGVNDAVSYILNNENDY